MSPQAHLAVNDFTCKSLDFELIRLKICVKSTRAHRILSIIMRTPV